MSYFLESYARSVEFSEKHDELARECQNRKLKYPAVYKENKGEFLAVANISYPSTTEMIADYLSKNAEYIIVYHEKLGREILILSHEGKYFHEFDKASSFLVVGILLRGRMEKVCYDLEDFLHKDEKTDEFRFELNN